MSTTCFTRFSLPLSVTQTLTRLRTPPSPTICTFHQLQPNPSLARTTNPRPTIFRMMATLGTSEPDGVPRSVPARVAHELHQAGHRYLDVRTVEEFNGGHTAGAENIPYMLRAGSGMKKNPDFLKQVGAIFGKDDEIIVGCLSGKRSFMAATELLSDGFTCITDIEGGYAAWVQNGLPTVQ